MASVSFVLLFLASILIYCYFFVYPELLKPVEFDLVKESRKILILSIQKRVEDLSMDQWRVIKNHENPLVFIYLYQNSESSTQGMLKKSLNLNYDPMATKNLLNPSNQTLNYIKDYLHHS